MRTRIVLAYALTGVAVVLLAVARLCARGSARYAAHLARALKCGAAPRAGYRVSTRQGDGTVFGSPVLSLADALAERDRRQRALEKADAGTRTATRVEIEEAS